MAYEELVSGGCVTVEAAGDLTQFTGLILSSGQVTTAGAAAADLVGVLQNDPDAAGEEATVLVRPAITKWVAGAAVSQDAPLTTDASGRAVTATSTDPIYGYALEAAGAADEVISVMFTGHNGTEA